ncbi:alkaline phosphatase-like protein, partial [Sodiomyces alkalinus F11]
PSLTEMTEKALDILSRSTEDEAKGFFIMIEASRIDHASHANDAAAHIWDVVEYNRLIHSVMAWVDEHPDTAVVSAADHETGGITLPPGYDPRPVGRANHSLEFLVDLIDECEGDMDDKRAYLEAEILPQYGVDDATGEEIGALLDAEDVTAALAATLNERIGVEWSTTDHSAVDVVLYAYAAGEMKTRLLEDLAGTKENVQLPRYVAEALGVSLDEVTALLRGNGTV